MSARLERGRTAPTRAACRADLLAEVIVMQRTRDAAPRPAWASDVPPREDA